MAFDKIESLMEQMRAARQRMKDEGKSALKEAFREFFDDCPEVAAINWTQYTPYWNDGEPCYFSVQDFCLVLTREARTALLDEEYSEAQQEDAESDHYDGDHYELNKTSGGRAKQISAQFLKFCKLVRDQDLLENTFGDHVKVHATPKGFDVTEYSHD